MIYVIDDIGEKQFSITNLILPNFLTIVVLLFYTKELLFGYNPKSKEQNKKSLLFAFFIILLLIIVQLPQFQLVFEDLELTNFVVMLILGVIFTSYIGILLNRVLIVKSLD